MYLLKAHIPCEAIFCMKTLEWIRTEKLPKKDDLKNCDNFRGIIMLSIPNKVLCKVILNRIDQQIDTKVREEQDGFSAG